MVRMCGVTPDDDERLSALMQRAQAGSEEAYADALTSFAILARRFIRRRVGDVVWLDDVVQDALISIDRSRHTFDRHRPVGPWFYAIVRRRLIDAWRRQERTARVEVAVDAPPDRADDVGRCDDEIDFARVRAALAALPPRQRAAVEGIQLNDEP